MVSVDQLNSSFKGKEHANSQMSVVTNTLLEGTNSIRFSLFPFQGLNLQIQTLYKNMMAHVFTPGDKYF